MLIQIKSVLKHIFKIKRLNKVAGECVQSWHPPLSPFFNHMNPELNFILIQLYYETTIHSTFNIKNKKKKIPTLFTSHSVTEQDLLSQRDQTSCYVKVTIKSNCKKNILRKSVGRSLVNLSALLCGGLNTCTDMVDFNVA